MGCFLATGCGDRLRASHTAARRAENKCVTSLGEISWACLLAPVGRRPSSTKSSASASNSLFTMCRVARISPLHAKRPFSAPALVLQGAQQEPANQEFTAWRL